MNKLLLFGLIMSFIACTNSANKNKPEKDEAANQEKAIAYYQKACDLLPELSNERDTILKAIAFLDSAISLSPEFKSAYFHKSFNQAKLGEYKNALNTIKLFEKIDSNNADIKMNAGVYYLKIGDESAAKTKLEEADKLWSNILDTIRADNAEGILHALMNRGAALKLLGQETQSNQLFVRIINDTLFSDKQYQNIKNEVDTLFLKRSPQSFRDYCMRVLTQNECH